MQYVKCTMNIYTLLVKEINYSASAFFFTATGGLKGGGGGREGGEGTFGS